jgi:SAM-dependent methyltransferase
MRRGHEMGATALIGAAQACPVCRATAPLPLLSISGRDYWRCTRCAARFLDPRQHPARDAEFAEYLKHRNDADDPAYRRFLRKLADPLLLRVAPGACGLDYGCGPVTALAALLRDAGHSVAVYDPFFHPDREPLRRAYDFVTCTEAAEHFHRPAETFAQIMQRVRPGGWLAIMTCFQTDDARFADWHYRRDPTHVVFYREQTLRYLASTHGWSCEIPAKDVALLKRPA